MPCARSSIIACLLGASLTAPAARAVEGYHYSHNGSIMAVSIEPDEVNIKYERPRAGLASIGISAGTVLFHGIRRGASVEGTAYTFRRGCQPARYTVRGRYAPGDRLVLSGPAPMWGTGCEIVGTRATSPHAGLAFDDVSPAE